MPFCLHREIFLAITKIDEVFRILVLSSTSINKVKEFTRSSEFVLEQINQQSLKVVDSYVAMSIAFRNDKTDVLQFASRFVLTPKEVYSHLRIIPIK